MKVFSTKDIRDIDSFTVNHEPVSSTDLMERAAQGCSEWICNHFSADTSVVVFTGPGNNGGDGWAIARLLSLRGFRNLELFHLRLTDIISPDSRINRERLMKLNKVPVSIIGNAADFPTLKSDSIVIDALFGSGLTRPLEGITYQLIRHINESGCQIIAIDIPSGLFGEDNSGNGDGIIHASYTLTFQFPKRSFFFFENEKFTGNWQIIPIGLHPAIMEEKETSYFYTTADDIRGKIKKRKIFSHKGTQGHALLIAGSYGMLGAAILATRACIRTGTGLITTHVPRSGYPIIQTAVPESIFSIDPDDNFFTAAPVISGYSAIGAGPGIGTSKETASGLKLLIQSCNKPLILDADALNIISAEPSLMQLLPKNTIITPHPGEFDRLVGKSETGFKRNELQIALSLKHHIIIILKGAFSSVTLPDGSCFYNSTGNPAMATAGAGDVLTGMILSLLAQGYNPGDAALLGTFVHGLAGDIAALKTGGQALIASDIIDNIGNAFNKLSKNEKLG